MKEIITEININVEPEKVWKIIIDIEDYPNWNPLIRKLSGNLAVGNKLEALFQAPGLKARTFKVTLVKLNTNTEFRWLGKLGGMGWLFSGDHYFILEKIDSGTRFIHGEKFSGLLIPFFKSLFKITEDGFNQMNLALKEKSEKK